MLGEAVHDGLPALPLLFDRFYQLPLGGAYLGQGKTMSGTGVPWGLAMPGKGRNLYASVTLAF